MPTYEYSCNSCNAEFECEQRISDSSLAACPSCGSRDTRRLISHSSFVLKGSGWYVTDYGRKGGNGNGSSRSTKPVNGSGSSKGDPATTAATPPAPAATADKPAASPH